jgi:outer membrane protein assembly factor BamB
MELKRIAIIALLFALVSVSFAADWPTYRGNAERTGNVDGKAGPAKPRVIWTKLSTKKEPANFIGSPSVAERVVCIASLGAFNSGSVLAMDAAANEAKPVWSKGPPLLKLPTVSSPVFAGGTGIFGDGMHQTDGALLRGVDATSGRLLWQHSVPGTLVHMEGAAVAAAGKVYVGAGHGGVLCLDPAKLSLNGKEQSTDEIRKLIDGEWRNLVDAYEKEKKADPDFAVPPSEDALPKPMPRLVWQVGVAKWHVDAPLALAGKQLLVSSAYLDLEKSGERALICLDPATGNETWKRPLDQNPWAGATVAGDVAIVGTCSVRLDPKEVGKAKGQLVAMNLADGEIKWKKPLTRGGIVSSVAVTDNLAIACATDGKVRAHDVATGNPRWTYDAGAPLFAGAAVVGKTAYVGDLKGVVHAIDLAEGTEVWKLDLNAAAGLKGAMIFGAPIVHGGRLYVGTCNLDSAEGNVQGFVCLGE